MADLHFDIEAPRSRHQDQVRLLNLPQNQGQEHNRRMTAIQDIQESLEYSALFNLVCVLVPLGKIGATLYVLLSMNYPCFGVKQIWLTSMLFHDILYAYIIILKLQIVIAMVQLDSANPNAPGSAGSAGIRHDVPIGSVGIEIGNHHHGGNAQNNPVHAADILAKRERVISLQSFCLYLWMAVFIFWLELNAMDIQGECDTPQINHLIFYYILIAWIWLMRSVILCIVGCLCLPLVLVAVLVFQRPNQIPASRAEITSLPVQRYSNDIPGNKECVICMSEYAINQKIIQLPCSPLHHFHEECIKDWLKISGQCPTCRARVH